VLNIDGDQISIAIDLDQGARLAALENKELGSAGSDNPTTSTP
jgi:hypothetical protein